MNAVGLYKQLPKKNCGACPQKQCMAFAIAVIKGDAELAECPLLTEEEVSGLQGSIIRKDWREELIAKLSEEVRTLRLADIAEGIGAAMDGDALVLNCMGRRFTISPDGDISTHGPVTPWIKILILHYIRMQGKGGLAGKWTSFSELRGGMMKAHSFERDCEEPFRDLCDRNPGAVAGALRHMGAEPGKGFPTEHAWRISLLPKVPVAILYWPRDEEFPSNAKILFDSTADKFLDVETLIFLVEGLVKILERFMDRPVR